MQEHTFSLLSMFRTLSVIQVSSVAVSWPISHDENDTVIAFKLDSPAGPDHEAQLFKYDVTLMLPCDQASHLRSAKLSGPAVEFNHRQASLE